MAATEPTLTRATSADADLVRNLTRAAYAKWVPVIGREPKPMTADHSAAVRDHLVDLLRFDGQVTALIEMTPTADHLLIENLAVAPAFQGLGHGSRLLEHAERLARTCGLSETKLYTNKQFAGNVQLYLARGYTVDREESGTLGVTVYMSKQLT